MDAEDAVGVGGDAVEGVDVGRSGEDSGDEDLGLSVEELGASTPELGVCAAAGFTPGGGAVRVRAKA
ncbi:hypothetical protein J7E29_02430 [Streptomyces sp. ISL-90]|nr:hypothetical protein [Streptomyces sp. ISL-90]